MSKYLKSIFVIIISLLVTTCDSGGDGGGGTNYGDSPGFENAASDNATGADNEVIATVKASSNRSVDVDAFISAVAFELGCLTSDIEVTGETTDGDLVYISFIFTSNDADQLVEDIQSALSSGVAGIFQVMIIIANMDDDIYCGLGEDCEGICGGSAFVDACGDCGGDSSGCDDGEHVGLYQLYSMKQYDGYDNDNTCSGSVDIEWDGPTFNIEDSWSDDTDCDDCYCDYGEFSAEIRIYVEFKANGQYRFFRFENESVDEETYCNGNCIEDGVGDCNCSTSSDDEDEFNLETGTWSVDNGMLSVNACTFQEWEWGTENNTSTCYDPDSSVMDGCLSEDWDGCNYDYNYDYDDEWEDVFEETSQGFYIHDPDDDGECERMEFRRINSFPDVTGCTDPFANNYNATATVDDGTCGAGSCYYGDNSRENSNKVKKSIFSFSR
mgnify:CR=1 FL=1